MKNANGYPTFLTKNYIYSKFVIEKWVNCRHFFIDEKNLQNLVWQEKLHLFNHTT